MSSAQQLHDAKVQALADEYQKQGYQVRIEPPANALPFDLVGYLPDLLAEKEGEHLLIEVKSSSAPISISRFRDVVETVRQQPGWRFLLVNVPPEKEGPVLPVEPLSWTDIASRIAHAQRLAEMSEAEAAILIYWSAFEALLRRHADNERIPITHMPVKALLDYLYSEAELSFEQFETAKRLSTVRNQLAHGFQIQDANKTVLQLQRLISELLLIWHRNRQAS